MWSALLTCWRPPPPPHPHSLFTYPTVLPRVYTLPRVPPRPVLHRHPLQTQGWTLPAHCIGIGPRWLALIPVGIAGQDIYRAGINLAILATLASGVVQARRPIYARKKKNVRYPPPSFWVYFMKCAIIVQIPKVHSPRFPAPDHSAKPPSPFLKRHSTVPENAAHATLGGPESPAPVLHFPHWWWLAPTRLGLGKDVL